MCLQKQRAMKRSRLAAHAGSMASGRCGPRHPAREISSHELLHHPPKLFILRVRYMFLQKCPSPSALVTRPSLDQLTPWHRRLVPSRKTLCAVLKKVPQGFHQFFVIPLTPQSPICHAWCQTQVPLGHTLCTIPRWHVWHHRLPIYIIQQHTPILAITLHSAI